MILINWNVNNSAPQKIAQQIDWLMGKRPDLLALTEVNCRHLAHWNTILREHGFWISAPGEATETLKGALIASRFPGRALPDLFEHPMPQCSVSAAVQTPVGELELHAVYARADGGYPWEKRFKGPILRAVADGIAIRRGPQIVAGDFNSPQAELRSRIVTFAERKNAKGAWQLPARAAHMEKILFKHEAELAIRQPRPDMVDAFKERPEKGSPATSWKHFRLDHIILSQDILPTSVCYHPVRRELSDHAAMIADW
jgi:endonuclease/exonuclease/phosphatase (EEP) superfamily protein YafD